MADINANQNNLTFLSTQTLAQFKASQNVDRIPIKKNPRTGKLFITFGAESGALSSKIKSQSDVVSPMVSYVETPEGSKFYLLHNEGQGGAETVFSL